MPRHFRGISRKNQPKRVKFSRTPRENFPARPLPRPAKFNQRPARAANSKFPFCARQLAGDARVVPARGVHRARKRLEQRLDNVMRLVAVKQFQMQIAAGFVGKGLEKFARQPKTERAGGVLVFFRAGNFPVRKSVHSAPDEVRSSAEIHDAAGEAFVHRHIGFAGERIFRMKAVAIAADAAFVAERGGKGLAEREAAVLDRVVRVHGKVAVAFQLQIHHGVLRKEREHVVEERDAGLDGGFALAVEVEPDGFDTALEALDFPFITLAPFKAIAEICFAGVERIANFTKLIDNVDLVTGELIGLVPCTLKMAVKLRELIGGAVDAFHAFLKKRLALNDTFFDVRAKRTVLLYLSVKRHNIIVEPFHIAPKTVETLLRHRDITVNTNNLLVGFTDIP